MLNSIFQTPWQRIVASTENLAASHETLAQKVEADVEVPLRQFATRNRELQALNSSLSNISSVAKDLSAAQKKAAKGGRRADEASASVDGASRQWESEAPYVFEQLQALDERRINNLRDVLTQLQTHEVDQVERSRTSAESCLNALLSLETADEIRTFTAKVAGGGPALNRRPSSPPSSTRPTTSTNQPPAPPPPRLTQDRSTRRQSSQDNVPGLPETPQKSRLGGLKRFGTVMGKRKSMAPPPPPAEKKQEKKRSLIPFRRGDSSRSFQDLEDSGADLSRNATQEPPSSLSQVQSQSTETTERERLPTQTEETSPMVNGTSNNPFMQPAQPQTPAQEAPPQQAGLMEALTPQRREPLTPQQSPPAATSQIHTQVTTPPEQFQPPAGPPPQQTQPSQPDSIPRAQPEAASITSTDPDETARNFAIRDKPIPEDESEAQRAMSSLSNQLRLQAQSSGVNRAVGSVRGRRDVRNTMFIPGGIDLPSPGVGGSPPTQPSQPQPLASPGSDLASPIARPTAPSQRTIHEDHVLSSSDTHSIHSAHSLANMPHHPELPGPGLNASIVETVNTWFGGSGIIKSFVTGEIALSYSPTSSIAPPDSETVRVGKFEVLEKVAANPMFVSAAKLGGEGGDGETEAGMYTIALGNIRKPTPTVGLKYQLHMDDADIGRYSPLLVSVAWQVVEAQASVILLYSLNPAFSMSMIDDGAGEITLKSVVISVALDPASDTKASSAMMSPTAHATFRKRAGAGAVTWRIPELTIRSTQERMLVRFLTPGGTARRGGVEVKFEVPGRTGSVVGLERKAAVADGGREVDPFSDADENQGRGNADGVEGDGNGKGWEEVATRRCLVSGRYTAS